MKIAATISGAFQVSQEQWRDWNITRVFDETATFSDVIQWAKARPETKGKCGLNDILLSEVDDAHPNTHEA